MVRKGWVNVKIVTAHGSRLDGFTFRNPAAQTKGKWLVWFGGNGEIAEGSQDSAHRYAHQLGINALVFNYRGIGDSQGRAASADDLLIDGASVLRYLHQIEKVEYKDMVLFGHSLGGGVATHLATSIDQAKGIPFVINDRSFSSLFEAVCVIGKNIAPLPRPAFQVLLNTVFGDLTTRDLWDRIPEDRKVIIYHKRDQVLPYVACSLHAALERDRVKMINVVELMETHHNLDPHNSATLQFNGHNDLIDILRRSI
jgi:pimeloyl-ACP methyl ester carboxylesterase